MHREWIDRQTKQATDAVLGILGKNAEDDRLIVAPAEREGPEPRTAGAPAPPAATSQRRQARRARKRSKR